MTSRRARGFLWALAVLLAASAALRLGAARQVGNSYLDVEEGYYAQGVALLSRGVFSQGLSDTQPRLWRGPVFPAFAALSEVPFRVPGPFHLRLAQQLLSLLGVAFAFWLGSRVAGPAAGLAGAALIALDPGQILSADSLNIHAFYGLSLLALAGAAALWAEDPLPARGAALGALLGATLLTRSTHFLAVPFVLAVGAWRGDGWRRAARRVRWPLAALALALAPWTIRNVVQFRLFQPLDAYSGAVNFYTASLGERGSFQVETAVARAQSERPELQTLIRSDRDAVFPILLELGVRHVLADPGRYVRTSWERFKDLYGPWRWALLIAALGVWLLRSRSVLAAAGVAASMGAYGLIGVQASYADAARPLVAMLVGWGLAALVAAAARRAPAAAPESPAARFGALLFAAAIGGTFLFADAAVLREPFVTRRLAREGGQYRPKEEARQIALLSRFERLAPNPEATRVLGDLLRSAGREAEACVVFERQWKADPGALDEGLNAADCRLRAGRGGSAEELARRILAGRGLSPGTELRARATLARALAARGAKKESVAQWRKVLGGATETRNALRLFDRLLDERRLDDALRFADRLAGAELGRGPDSPAAQAVTGAVPALGGAGAEGRLPDAPPGRGDEPWSLTLGSPVAPAPKAPSGDVSAEFRYTADAARSLWASGDRALAARDIAGLRVPESSSRASRVQMLMLRAGVKADTNDFAGAEADIRAALALEPKNYEVLCRLVQFLRERNRLPESLAAARILVEVPTAPDDVNRAEKWLQRGETLLAMGRTDEAVADVRRALESKPGDVASLWLMIQALQRGGRSREALAFADRMVQAATSPSQRAEALGLRAKVRESLGQIQQAEEDSQSAVAADPGSTVALEARVQLLRSSGRLAEARVLADRMVAAGRGVPAPQRAVLLEQRAQVRSLLGDAGGAEADLRAALETDPDALTATRALASTMLARGVPAKALQLIDAAIKGAPTGAARAEGLTFRAQVLADMGRGAEAAADLKAAAPPETGAFDASAPARSARRLLAAGRAREALTAADAAVDAAASPAARVEDLILRARSRLALGRTADAAADLRAASAGGGGDVSASFRRVVEKALAELSAGGRAEAESEVAALRIPATASGKSRVEMLMLRGEFRAESGDSASAEDDFRAALALAPRDYEVLCRLTQVLRDRNRLTESLAVANVLVTVTEGVDPKNRAEKWLQRGETLLTMGRTDEAVSDVRRALEAKPGDVPSLWLMIQALQREGNSRDALTFADRMVQAATAPSQRAEALGLRAKVRESLGQTREAEKDSRSAVAADPGNTVALEARVQLLRSSGRLAEALALADRMVAAGRGDPAPRRAVLLEQRAQIKNLIADAAGAIADLREALRVFPDSLSAARSLAAADYAAGRPQEALPLLDRAIADAPTAEERARDLAFRARVRLTLGRATGAAEDLALADGAPDPADVSAAGRARVLLAAGRAADARAALDSALAASASPAARSAILTLRARAALALGRAADAAEDLRSAAAGGGGDVSAEFQRAVERARAELAAGGREEALREISALRVPEEAAPGSRVEMLMQRGEFRAECNDFPGAEADIRAALALQPRNYEVLCHLVQFLRDRNRLEESLAAAQVLVTVKEGVDPKNRAEKWLQRAETLMRLGRTDDAVADARRALAEKPGDVPSSRLLVQILLRAGRAKEALPEADRMVRTAATPEARAQALGLRAQVRGALGIQAGADEDSRRAVSADPNDHAALEERVQRLRAAGRLDEALALADRMVAAGRGEPAPRRAVLFEQRAQVKQLRGDAVGAEGDLRAALKVQPDSLSAQRALAASLLAAGRAREALPFIAGAVAADPTPSARANDLVQRARTLRALGRGAEAAADLREAVSAADGAAVAGAADEAAKAAGEAKTLQEAFSFADILVEAASEARSGAAAPAWDRYAEWLKRLREAGRDADAARALDRALAGPLSRAPATVRAAALTARAALRWDANAKAAADVDFAAALAADAGTACRHAPLLADPARLPEEYFTRCLRRFPRDAELLGNQGVALWRDKRFDEARASLRAAVAADPGNIAAALSLRTALGDAGAAETAKALRAALVKSAEPKDSPLRAAAREALGSSR